MTIASALDKLNDKLAGSDQPASQTIEGMILRLIDNIDNGGGGGGGGALIVHGDETGTIDKTYAEIVAAINAGSIPILSSTVDAFTQTLLLSGYTADETGYIVYFGVVGESTIFTFTAETENGYPTYTS